jgi:hypothetical protein
MSGLSETACVEEIKAQQRKLLMTPLGIPGSGYTRYAAAMWFFQSGEMTAEELEAYRVCSKLDSEDPHLLYKKRQSTRP